MKKIVFLILTILWMLLIFYFSNCSGSKSSNTSNFIVKRIVNITESITNKKLTENEINCYISYPIRKIAHFTEYFILGILLYITLNLYGVKEIFKICFLICILYSLSDEIHQLFIINRSGKITDCIIDVMGSYVGINIIKKIIA